MLKNKKFFLCYLFWLLSSTPACANAVWPSLYIVTDYMSIHVIILGLITEIIFVKYFTKISWLKATGLSCVMNLISAALGFFLIPISGLAVELLLLPISVGTFHVSHWFFDFVAIIFLNTLIEGIFLRKILKTPFKEIFWWLFCANVCSVLYCVFYIFKYAEKIPIIFW